MNITGNNFRKSEEAKAIKSEVYAVEKDPDKYAEILANKIKANKRKTVEVDGETYSCSNGKEIGIHLFINANMKYYNKINSMMLPILISETPASYEEFSKIIIPIYEIIVNEVTPQVKDIALKCGEPCPENIGEFLLKVKLNLMRNDYEDYLATWKLIDDL
jgi:hypothetical protein